MSKHPNNYQGIYGGLDYMQVPHGGRPPSDEVVREMTQRYIDQEKYASEYRGSSHPVQVADMNWARDLMKDDEEIIARQDADDAR